MSDDKTTRLWLWRSSDLVAKACTYLTRNMSLQEWDQYVGNDIPYHVTCQNLSVPEDAQIYLKTKEQNQQQIYINIVGSMSFIGLMLMIFRLRNMKTIKR